MSLKDPELLKALEQLEAAGFQPVSFTTSSSQLTSSKQNNLIIELLLSLHKKLDIFLEREKQRNLEQAVDDLSTKINNLNLGKTTEEKPFVQTKQKGLYVWQDPLDLIAEYKRIHGASKNSFPRHN